MNIAIKQSATHENTIIWAIVCSILLHVLFAVIIPNVKFNPIKKPEVLKVELVRKPETPPAIESSQIQPEPKPKVEPKAEPKSIIKQLPNPVKNNPAPIEPPTQTEVIAIAPKADVSPATTVPPQPTVTQVDAPKKTDTNDDEYNLAKNTYKDNVLKEIQRNLRYPRIATDRHMTGKAKVEVYLDAEGNVVSASIIETSGHAVLDSEALAVVKRSNLKQYMNETLSGRINPLRLPVSFTLADQ